MHAATLDTVTLATVVIIGSPSFRNIYAEGNVPALDAVIASAWYGTRTLTWEYYFEYKEFVAQARINPATTPDARCNIGATAQTKNTTSRAGVTDRFLAAQQIFAFIRGYDNAASLRGLLRSNSSYFYNGAKQFTFQVTYADGGKEGWIVASVLTGALVNEGNVPGSLSLGDGTVKSCTTTG
ncbi:MAG: hypothetical protein V4787_11440 [Pseudomonadota bacterium]